MPLAKKIYQRMFLEIDPKIRCSCHEGEEFVWKKHINKSRKTKQKNGIYSSPPRMETAVKDD